MGLLKPCRDPRGAVNIEPGRSLEGLVACHPQLAPEDVGGLIELVVSVRDGPGEIPVLHPGG